MVIIIVLKLDSEVNSRHDPSHGSRGSTQADPDQCKDNVFYYHNFKTQFEGWPRQDASHGSEGSIRIDPSQHINKIDYYHSFEAWLILYTIINNNSIPIFFPILSLSSLFFYRQYLKLKYDEVKFIYLFIYLFNNNNLKPHTTHHTPHTTVN
jgi:hypothetical protein